MDENMKYEDIVNKLENSTESLDESIKLFEEGVKLSQFCSSKLKAAEQKITMLTKENNND